MLIDAAWLWEEYLAFLLDGRYNHYVKDRGKRFYLFEDGQQIIPDYLSADGKIVADAKYIPLDNEQWYGEEKALAIYYKTITYMYRFCTHKSYLFYPHPDNDIEMSHMKIKSVQEGVNGGSITKVGLRIPQGCDSYASFCSQIQQYEQEFLNKLE